MLKKELVEWLDVFNNVTVPKLIENGFKPTPTNAREGLANLTSGLTPDNQEVKQTFDDYVLADEYNVPVRIYNPNPEEKLPVLLFMHGGGHMAGSVTVYNPICKRLANLTNHIVVSVEYRLAPENPYPAGVNDCVNAAKGVFDTLDSRGINYERKLSVAGDSGGGANSATLCAKVQDSVKLDKQILIYPSLDYTMGTVSMDENGAGYLLGKSKIAWYFDNYFLKGEDREEASPVNMRIGKNFPETLVFTAQFDPLRDEGLAYVDALKEAGITVEHHNLENMIHTYMSMEDICKEECDFTYQTISKFLNK